MILGAFSGRKAGTPPVQGANQTTDCPRSIIVDRGKSYALVHPFANGTETVLGEHSVAQPLP